MKKALWTTLLLVSVLTPFVLAECPSPNYPVCPANSSLIRTNIVDVWTCCDMTRACAEDGTKYPRFIRTQSVALYLGADGQLHECVAGAYGVGPDVGCCD